MIPVTTTRNCNNKKYVGGSNAAKFTNDKLLYRQYKDDGTIYNNNTEKSKFNLIQFFFKINIFYVI